MGVERCHVLYVPWNLMYTPGPECFPPHKAPNEHKLTHAINHVDVYEG